MVRFWMLWYLDNPVIKTVFIIWILCVLAKTIFRPYVNYYIILRNCSAWDAVIKSMSLTISNFWLTIRWLLRQLAIRFRFFLNSCIIIWVPILIMTIAVQLNIIDNSAVEVVSWILVSIWIIVFIYLEAIYVAFDNTYWYKIFLEAERRSNLK